MFRKLSVIIAMELIIGLGAFVLAGEKAQFGEIVILLVFGILMAASIIHGLKRFRFS